MKLSHVVDAFNPLTTTGIWEVYFDTAGSGSWKNFPTRFLAERWIKKSGILHDAERVTLKSRLHNVCEQLKPSANAKKDPNCEHIWEHLSNRQWTCTKCGAIWCFMCGCGGSMYVCSRHHEEQIANMIKTEGSIEAYLAKYAW